VSNPDLAGPYWQDEGDAGYGSGWRAGRDLPARQQPAWDDGGGFWRDDSSQGNAGRDRGPSRHGAAPYRDRQSPPRGSRREPERADDWGSHRDSGRSPGGARRSADADRADWTGRLSQTAGDLKSKLGNMRTRAAASLGGDRRQGEWSDSGDDFGRGGAAAHGTGGNGASNGSRGAGRRGPAGSADDDFWAEQGARRAGSSARGSQSQGGEAGAGRGGRRAAHAGGYGTGRNGAGGNGAGGNGASRYEVGGYGPGDYGPADYDSRTAAGRTALRDPAGDFWDQPDRTSRGVRSRVAERQYAPGGGNGRGGGGHGGGRSNGGGPHSRGGGFKNWLLYGRWWRHWTWKKAVAVAGAGIALCFLLGIAGFFILYEMTPIPTASEQTANWQSSTVYFANGKQMGTFDTSVDGVSIDRLLLNSTQIPSVMTHAMTAAEDRHFYTEGGVSLTGLMRAAYEDVRGDGNLQGGSTITMQYAKNYYSGVNTGQNLSTKLKEIFIAMKLGRAKSKSWVMTNYLNTVPFGSTIDGLGAAAESYFNINLTRPGAKLSVAQAALLAAMPNNPAVFSSVVLSPKPQSAPGYSALQARFEYVLTNMVRDGSITQAQANAATFPKITPPPGGNGETGVTGYLMNMVLQQLEAPVADGGYGLTNQQVDTRGYKIRTTFSMAKINGLARAVQAEKGQMKTAAEDSGGVYVSFRSYDRIGAVLENSKTGAIVAIYGGPGYLSNSKRCNASDCMLNMAESAEQVGSSFKPYVLSAAVKQGMSVFTSKLNGYSPIWIPLTSVNGQSAQMALSPTNPPPGCPRPVTGQTGDCNSTNGTRYFLFNEASENYGALAPNIAAAVSSDSAFEDLAHRDGVQSVIDMAQQFGVGQTAFVEPCGASSGGSGTVAATIAACNDLTGPGYKVGGQWYPGHGLENNFSPTKFDKGGEAAGTPGSPAIALGENPLTPIEQASTFATLADDGVYHTPHVIASLEQGNTKLPSHVITRTVLSPGAAADVDWALSFDNNLDQGNLVGTAEGNIPFRRGDVIGKTGTLGTEALASQAWFIGATPDQFALSVALFTNDPGKQNLDNLPYAGSTQGSQGGAWPASIWNAYMEDQESNAPMVPLFQQVQAGFVPWIQVLNKPKPKKQFCKPGGGFGHGGGNQNCVCAPGAVFCGHNPNPQPSCNGNCNPAGPSPTPSCEFGALGASCSSPSPSVSPSVSPSTSCSAGPPGQCQAADLTADVRSSPDSGSSPGSAASIVVLAAEDAATRLTALLGLVI
jgi:membrane peptidoglycan carboxypeptidase